MHGLTGVQSSLIVMFLFAAGCASVQDPHPVYADQLGTKTTVIGNLGKPLGQLMTIEGVTRGIDEPQSKSNADALVVHVITIDGIRLNEARTIVASSYFADQTPKFNPSSKVKFIGFEDGGFCGTPDDAYEIIGPHQTHRWGFATHFCICRDVSKLE